MADLTIIRGDDFRAVVTLTSGGLAFDLTGYSAKSQIRPTTALNAPLIAEFTATIDVDPTTGILTLELANADTADLEGSGVWDLQITDGDGKVTTVVSGAVTFTPDVTRVEP